jgi:superfamily II DNA/RNA helicase
MSENDHSPVLVSTDLASRGLDIPGVTAIVQLQFAGNVVAHLHRMGRCGRAGERNGRGIIFYNSREKSLVDVVRDAERQQKEKQMMMLRGDVIDDDDDDEEESSKKGSNTTDGTVSKAFSRRRGFTKKIKKIRREEQENSNI